MAPLKYYCIKNYYDSLLHISAQFAFEESSYSSSVWKNGVKWVAKEYDKVWIREV